MVYFSENCNATKSLTFDKQNNAFFEVHAPPIVELAIELKSCS